jgi:PIN domain nuclease of toxin-antitoxin system
MNSDKSKYYILDASALIALLIQEKGYEKVVEILPHSMMSSVNVAEVAKFLKERNKLDDQQLQNAIYSLVDKIYPFDAKLAFLSASIIEKTKPFVLSLGDRACIALGLSTGYHIYTADKVWAKLDLDCTINLIR